MYCDKGKGAKRSQQYRDKQKKQKVDNLIVQCTVHNDKTESDLTNAVKSTSASLISFNDTVLQVDLSNKINEKSNTLIKEKKDKLLKNEEISDLLSLEEPEEIQELREWIVNSNVPHSETDKLLLILRKRLLPDLPKVTCTLLGRSPRVEGIIQMESKKKGFGEFFYFGLEGKLKKVINLQYHPTNTVELIFNIDGFSPFKSSPVQIWPILCKVYSKKDVYEPFSVAVYSGKSKPKDPNAYLHQFVQELNQILVNGIQLENLSVTVKIKYFVCDRPARAFIKNTVGHTAASGCERCTVTGKKHDGVMAFLDLTAAKRTDCGFRDFEHPDYHVGASILCHIKPPIDMIMFCILDTMHLLRAGVTNRVIEFLMKPSQKKVRLSAELKKELQRRTEMIGPCIPDEFPRKMRPIEDYTNYKSVEYKFFLDYAAPIVMRKLLSKEMYDHLMLLVLSCRILSGSQRMTFINECRKDLTKFVEEASKEDRYGPSFVALNVHDLIHLCDDIQATGSDLNELSAFTFESYLGILSNTIKSPTHVVAQFCNRVLEKEQFITKTVKDKGDIEVVRQTKTEILNVRYKNFVLTTSHPNNTVLLNDQCIGQISKIILHNNEIKISIKKYCKIEPLFTGAWNSDLIKIFEVSHLSKDHAVIKLDKVYKKMINFEMNFAADLETKYYVVPLLHE